MKFNFLKALFVVLIFSTIFPFLASADLQISTSDINIEMTPEIPVPYQNITITVGSYAADLDRAAIEWLKDGKTVLGGIGRTSYTMTAPAPNSNSNITIRITPNGSTKTIIKNLVIKPSEVDMLWEATSSYVPPFYKGKALPTSESFIKVTAIPNTSSVSSLNKKNMVYTWQRNDKAVKSSSGYSKGVFSFQNDSMNASEKIKVSASSTDGSFNTKGEIEIPIVNPSLLFYRKSPIEGTMYGNVLQNETSLYEEEMTIVAEPYFLSLVDKSDFDYKWKINNKPINTPKDPLLLTVRPSSRGGYATIELDMESISKLFQKVSSTIKINL